MSLVGDAIAVGHYGAADGEYNFESVHIYLIGSDDRDSYDGDDKGNKWRV